MKKRLKHFIEKHGLFNPNDHLLVAVSGGADSMVLLFLLHSLRYKISVAHCNFNLRPGDCDDDQQLVGEVCRQYQIPCYVKNVDAMKVAEQEKISVEMAAREIRYRWFEELRQQIDARYIVTAHHANDNVETVFLAMTRGTGLKGLTGIQPKNGVVVRPLLWADRKAIEAYAKSQNIPFRTDKTNLCDAIPRNRIRLNVIPELEKINPSLIQTMQQNIAVWNDWFVFAQQQLAKTIVNTIEEKDDTILFYFRKIETVEEQRLILFHLLQKIGYDGSFGADLVKIIDLQTGKSIETYQHQIINNRDTIVIKPLDKRADPDILIETIPCLIETPLRLKITRQSYRGEPLSGSAEVAFIDADKVGLPLTLRRWKTGDRFMPFGMKTFKKISDFLTDIKVTPVEKREQWVLCYQDEIIWVVGKRIDNRYRVDENTRRILVVAPPDMYKTLPKSL